MAKSLGLRRGGQPKNLNATRHPWRTFWRRRALRAEDRWILPTLEAYSESLASDKPDLSETEKRMVEIAETARGASMLILAEAARRGFIRQVDGSWDLAPGAKELARFLSLERQALQTLGLERRPRDIPALEDIRRSLQEEP